MPGATSAYHQPFDFRFQASQISRSCLIHGNDSGYTDELVRKECTMGDDERTTRADQGDGPDGRMEPDWARRATSERAAEWSSDRVLDPGDTHDKGERSLCVGEAA
jgi:hypothetical protein